MSINIPDSYRYSVIPHIMVSDGAGAIEFYQRAFGAREEFRMDAPDGGVMHAEITIGQSRLMLGETTLENLADWKAPSILGGTSVTLHVFVSDVDELTERARTAGAEVLKPPADEFHGDRTAILKDPYGHLWVLLTHLEDVSEEEMLRRMSEAT